MERTEEQFLKETRDSYAIYQLKQTIHTHDLRFMPYAQVKAAGMGIERQNYDAVYAGLLESNHTQNLGQLLEQIYLKFNINRPDDYMGRSLSISDVIALRIDGNVGFHYVDMYTFQTLTDFLPENLLHAAKTISASQSADQPASRRATDRLPLQEQLRHVAQDKKLEERHADVFTGRAKPDFHLQ